MKERERERRRSGQDIGRWACFRMTALSANVENAKMNHDPNITPRQSETHTTHARPMQRGTPAIACIGVVGKNVCISSHDCPHGANFPQDNPLHISLFPPNARDALEFQLLLHTSLDIFAHLVPLKAASPDFGLLQAIDERLSMHGWLTNTGVKLVIVVDMEGRPLSGPGGEQHQQSNRDREAYMIGLREADLRPAFKAIQKAYVALLRNPFYEPDDHDPVVAMQNGGGGAEGSLQITSRRFISEVERIGKTWYPGIGAM